MDEKQILKGLSGDHGETMKEGVAAATQRLKDMLTNQRKLVVAEGGSEAPLDDATMRRAMHEVWEGARNLLVEVKDKEDITHFPPLEFDFIGAKDKQGRLCARIKQQGLDGLFDADDKDRIMKLTRTLVDLAAGELFVVLVDEAWMYSVKRAEGSDEIMKGIESGSIRVSQLPDSKKQECVVMSGIGLGVQYLMSCKIVRDEKGRIVDLIEGEIVCSRDQGAVIAGRMSAGWGKTQ